MLAALGAGTAPAAELRLALDGLIFDVEDARRVIHRTAQQARVRQDDRMGRRIALAPAVVLHAADTFPGHEVGPGAAQAGRLDGLVTIDHDLPFGRGLDHFLEMADADLAVAEHAVIEPAAGIARLQRVDAQ